MANLTGLVELFMMRTRQAKGTLMVAGESGAVKDMLRIEESGREAGLPVGGDVGML